MENLTIRPTDTTPAIDFNHDTHELKITGESYPENVGKFFDPVYSWIEEFLNAGENRSIVAEFELTMFNSSTAKALLDILDLLNEGAASEESMTVNWRYHEDNDLIEEFGEDLQEDYPTLTVNLMPISSD